ncbi:CPXCG motif-containing cysteine-rich protein [Arenimonas donghaensis]|uniref:CPXCG motif-containing cysteine-rich protein n=1 Tax=Arenimonas donghaensis DSM 18148 = HO3-R19 TaxID=1121014 RepID=A0A087MG35_9GAMM|nr:CPXCG motif-containing cysteine-rich protein [Arenimonas donghaensis]KFL35838.1 hypothetical protein N788_07260 [Arenimonas donghaensis DSM 18148 = HO3-R19]
MLDTIVLTCPHCGERFETVADPSAGDTEYVEDCFVCCRPITVRLHVGGDGGLAGFEADRDD